MKHSVICESTPDDSTADESSITQVVTGSDGHKMLVVMKQDVVLLQIKLGTDSLFEISSKELHQYIDSADTLLEA